MSEESDNPSPNFGREAALRFSMELAGIPNAEEKAKEEATIASEPEKSKNSATKSESFGDTSGQKSSSASNKKTQTINKTSTMTQRKRQTTQYGTITSIPASSAMSEKNPNPLATALAVYIAKLAPPPKSTFKGGYVLCGTTPYQIIKTDDPHSVDFHIGFCNDKHFRTVCVETNGEDNRDKYLPRGVDRSNLNDLAHDLRDIIYEMESVHKKGEDTSGIEHIRVGSWNLNTVLKMVTFGAEQYYCKQNEDKLFLWENAGKPKGKGSMYAVVHLEMERGYKVQ